MRLPPLCSRLLLSLFLVLPVLAAETPDVGHRGETYDEYNTRRIAEEVRNHRNRNPDFKGPGPSENADWGAWERYIAQKRGQIDDPVVTAPPRNSALEDYEAKRIASERARAMDANEQAREQAAIDEFNALLRSAHDGDGEALLEVGRRLSTTYYYPSQTRIDGSLAETVLSYFLRAYPSEDWGVKVNLIGLIPSLLEPQKYPLSESPSSVVVFSRGGVNHRQSEENFEDSLRTRIGRGEAFAALQLAAMHQARYVNGYAPFTQLPDAERQAEVRRLLEIVRKHCSYVGTFFIGAMILNFPDTDGEYVACLKSILENPNLLPGDSDDGYYTDILRDLTRLVLAVAQLQGKVPGASFSDATQHLRSGESPLYRFHRYLAGKVASMGFHRLSVFAAAEDFAYVLEKNANVTFEQDPLFRPNDLPYKIALMRAIGHLQGDGFSWEPGKETVDVPAAERELKAAIAAAPDAKAVDEPTLRLWFLEARQGNQGSADRLLARTDAGLAAILRGLVLASGVQGGTKADPAQALNAFAEGLKATDPAVRLRDIHQVMRRLVLVLADYPDQKDRVHEIAGIYFPVARFSHAEAKVVNHDFALAAQGKTRAPFTAARLRRPMTEERIKNMDTEARERTTAALLERLAKEPPPATRPRKEEELRRDIRTLGWLARAGHLPALQALREKAEKGETDAAIEAFRSLLILSPANAYLCVPLLDVLGGSATPLLYDEKWLPESVFPAASMLNPSSNTFTTLLPLLLEHAPAHLAPGEFCFRENPQGPSVLRQIVSEAYRQNPDLKGLLIETAYWEDTDRRAGRREDTDAHRALTQILENSSREAYEAASILRPENLQALRDVGEPFDWYRASMWATPYARAQELQKIPIYMEMRDYLLGLSERANDPLAHALRASFLEKICRDFGTEYDDPAIWPLAQRELQQGRAHTLLPIAGTLLNLSRANALTAIPALERAARDLSLPRHALAAQEVLAEWGSTDGETFTPGPLLRYLRQHPLPTPAQGFWVDEESSRVLEGPTSPLSDTALMLYLRAQAARGDAEAAALLQSELDRRRQQLYPPEESTPEAS